MRRRGRRREEGRREGEGEREHSGEIMNGERVRGIRTWRCGGEEREKGEEGHRVIAIMSIMCGNIA